MKFRMTAGVAGVVILLGTGCDAPKGNPESAPVEKGETPKAEVRFVRRPHLQFKNERDMGEYLTLQNRKKGGVEHFRALTRQLQEKALEVKPLNDALEKEFHYLPQEQYDFNKDSKVLSRYEPDGKGGVIKKEVMKMTPASEKRFNQLLEQRKQLLDEASSIHSAGLRAQAELTEVQNRLMTDYSEARDREYELDTKMRTLIEKVPVPARFELEGE